MELALDMMRWADVPELLHDSDWKAALGSVKTAVGVGLALPRETVGGLRESSWLLLELELAGPGRGNGLALDLYLGLAAPPVAVHVRRSARAGGIARLANRAVGHSRIGVASDRQLASALVPHQPPEMVAVYDVGQGACQAICDRYGRPLLYVDFGGGCLANASSYPAPKFCWSQSPNVLLSHWDFDHWRSGDHDPASHRAKWVAPRQRWGPTAGSLVGRILSAGGEVLLWGKRSAPALPSYLEVHRCTGTTRNDTGLAACVTIAGPTLTATQSTRALLPGDARYSCISQSMQHGLTHVVGSHHGSGHVGVPPRPGPPAGRRAELVFSYGKNARGPYHRTNSFGHPNRAAVRAAVGLGWTQYRTFRGNVAFWPPSSRFPGLCAACVPQCNLATVQP